jgi:hypothetical protein
MRVSSSDAERRQHAGEDDGLGLHSAAPQSALPVSMPLLAGHDNEPLARVARSPYSACSAPEELIVAAGC